MRGCAICVAAGAAGEKGILFMAGGGPLPAPAVNGSRWGLYYCMAATVLYPVPC
jgi:hypothetical protein